MWVQYPSDIMDTVHLPLPGSLALTVLLLCVPLLVALVAKTRTKLPPGPRGHPLFGNAFQMPTEAPWVTYTAWAKIYGAHCTFLPRELDR